MGLKGLRGDAKYPKRRVLQKHLPSLLLVHFQEIYRENKPLRKAGKILLVTKQH